MNSVLNQVIDCLTAANNKPDFLEVLFRENKQVALDGRPIVLFGAGGLGSELLSTLYSNNIYPVCFCDNDTTRSKSYYFKLPVITYEQLKIAHRNSLIVIATQKYRAAITRQLLSDGFTENQVLCKSTDDATPFIYMYSMIGTQNLISEYRQQAGVESILNVLIQHGEDIEKAYNILSDVKSKALFISKLALMASNGNFELFRNFMLSFSEPVNEFGFGNYEGTQEDYYYFNNDVVKVDDNEVYIDVGAYDGDTVITFIEACKKFGVDYKQIYAFEPDPNCFRSLERNVSEFKNISCHQVGLWSETTSLQFASSQNTIHDQAGAISENGDLEIRVVSIDDFLRGREATFIKMDPGGNIIPEVIRGAANTIQQFKPKLAIGAYHSIISMFQIPLLIHNICPNYKLYLRHNTDHLCDTDMYATL